MSEELNNQAISEQEAPAAEEIVAEEIQKKKSLWARLNILEHLQRIVDNKWVALSGKISNILLYIACAITAYLGVIGYAFDVAFVTLLITAATALYSTLLAVAVVILVRGKKRRIRKKAKRTLIRACVFLLFAALLLIFSKIPYYDGRYGNPYHLQDYDAFYYDIISDEGERVIAIRDADADAQIISIPKEIHDYPVKYIDADAFVACTKLSTFKVNSSHDYFKAENGVLYSKDMATLLCYPKQALRLKNNITIHASVTTIGDYAFAGSACRVVAMPNVTKIGDHAFDGCSELSSVDAPKLTYIGDYAFADCTQLRLFDIPSTVSYVGDSAFYNMPTTSVINVFATADTMRAWCSTWNNGCRASIED